MKWLMLVSDRGRLAGVLLGFKAKSSDEVKTTMELADYLIAEGYGVVHVEKATALEEAAGSLVEAADESWDISDVIEFLYDSAAAIYDEGSKK